MDRFAAKVAGDPYARFLGITINEARQRDAPCSLKIPADMVNFPGATLRQPSPEPARTDEAP